LLFQATSQQDYLRRSKVRHGDGWASQVLRGTCKWASPGHSVLHSPYIECTNTGYCSDDWARASVPRTFPTGLHPTAKCQTGFNLHRLVLSDFPPFVIPSSFTPTTCIFPSQLGRTRPNRSFIRCLTPWTFNLGRVSSSSILLFPISLAPLLLRPRTTNSLSSTCTAPGS
jgi:hypothetical protein